MAEKTEPTTPELREGGVYFATGASPLTEGTPGVYVRTETRSGGETPTALFVHSRGRVVFTRSTPIADVATEWTEAYAPPNDDAPVGSAWKLEIAAALRERDEIAEQLDAALDAALDRPSVDPKIVAEHAGLKAAMKRAIELAPEHKRELQATYRSHRGSSS